MLEAYRAHVAERAEQHIPPKPLDPEWTAGLVELLKNPPAGEEEPGFLWQLKRALYGTRRASYFFQAYVMEVHGSAGFSRPVVACQVFWCKSRKVYLVGHGDDFMAIGTAGALDWHDGVLAAWLVIK